MIQKIRCLIENIKLLFKPVIINAFVFYDKSGTVRHENWGDDINYYFLNTIVKRPIVIFNRCSFANRLGLKNYLCIGSVIDMLCKSSSEVWGSGIIDGDKTLRVKPKKVYAVRGPLTRQKLLSEGVECPEVYGAPALLVAKYYQPKVENKYKYGFIAHVSNLDKIKEITIDGMAIKDRSDVLIIDLSRYDKWTDIPDQICSCENIISGSLHGLIMAEAYKIPNVWVEFGTPLIGGHFKFHDFLLSIGSDRENPVSIKNKQIDSKVIDATLSSWQPGSIDLQPLIEACPFEINI